METRSLISFLTAIFIGLASAFPQGAVRVNNATGVVNDPSNFVPANSGTGANQFASGTDARITGAVQSAGGTLNSGTLAGVTGVSGTMSGNFTRSGTTSGGTLNSVSVVSGTAIDLDMSGTTTGNNVRFGTTTGGVYNTGTFSGVTRFTGTADLNGSFSGTGVIPGANLQASGTGNAGAITTGSQSIAGAKTFTDNITANGTANTMPNQTAASSYSVMTRTLSDARQLRGYILVGDDIWVRRGLGEEPSALTASATVVLSTYSRNAVNWAESNSKYCYVSIPPSWRSQGAVSCTVTIIVTNNEANTGATGGAVWTVRHQRRGLNAGSYTIAQGTDTAFAAFTGDLDGTRRIATISVTMPLDAAAPTGTEVGEMVAVRRDSAAAGDTLAGSSYMLVLTFSPNY